MGDMNTKQDVERGEGNAQEEIVEPLIQGQKYLPDEGGSGSEDRMDQSSKKHPWMVYLSTFVAVCGSYEFGCCVSAEHLVIYSLTSCIYFFQFENQESITLPEKK